MSRRVWGWGLVGGLLAVTLVAWGTWSTISLLGRSVRTEHTSYEQPIAVVDIRAAGSIRVIEGAPGRISVTERIERSLVAPRRSADVVGDRLVLRSECRSVFSTFCTVSYDVEVPPGTALKLRSEVGGIRVSDVDGEIDAVSTAGSVSVVAGSGNVDLHSSAGGVRVIDRQADRIGASSTAGAVTVEAASPPAAVEASSSAGSVTVVVPPDETTYAVDASTDAGGTKIQIRTDPQAQRTISAHSSAGDVTVRYP